MSGQFVYKNNRFQQLKGFCLVVQLGSVAKAADKMGLSQGAISLQIQSLERDLGIMLFDRIKKKMILTDKGKIFYQNSMPHLQGVEELFVNFANKLNLEEEKIVNIGASYASICYILPKFLKKFESLYQQVQFKIRNLVRNDAFARLKEGKVDLLLYAMESDKIPSEFDFIPVVEYKTVLLTHKDHVLTGSKKVTMADIKKFQLLKLDENFVTMPNFNEALKIHSLETKMEFEMANYEILKKFVKTDLGIAIISEICLEGEDDKDLFSHDLSDYFPNISYGILLRKSQHLKGLTKEFVEILKNEKLLTSQKYEKPC